VGPRPPTEPPHPRLGKEALAEVATSLADLYALLYGERPVDPRASLTANMVAWVFQGGLAPADEGLLRHHREDELRRFRQGFFDVVDEQLRTLVGDLTGAPVTYSFFGFDPHTRTTHGVFVLDLRRVGAEERRALVGWSEQVRRNSQRLREERAAAGVANRELQRQVRSERERISRERVEQEGRRP
jgi:uncharacterized protein YbcI